MNQDEAQLNFLAVNREEKKHWSKLFPPGGRRKNRSSKIDQNTVVHNCSGCFLFCRPDFSHPWGPSKVLGVSSFSSCASFWISPRWEGHAFSPKTTEFSSSASVNGEIPDELRPNFPWKKSAKNGWQMVRYWDITRLSVLAWPPRREVATAPRRHTTMQKLSKWRPVELGNHKRRSQGTTVLMGILDVEHCETMFSGV